MHVPIGNVGRNALSPKLRALARVAYHHGVDSALRLSGGYATRSSVSLCTAVKNRFEHLRATVLRNLEDNEDHERLELVIVNYNCPDPATERWVSTRLREHIESGRVNYYRVFDEERYRRAHAKNLAFRLARGTLLCNVDADNFTGPGFASFVAAHLGDGRSFLAGPRDGRGLAGRIAVRREHFLRVGGYDERIVDWGGDDREFVSRLEMSGLKRRPVFKSRHLRAIQHCDDSRTMYSDCKDKWECARSNERLMNENRARNVTNPNGGRFGIGRVQRNFRDWLVLDPWHPTRTR